MSISSVDRGQLYSDLFNLKWDSGGWTEDRTASGDGLCMVIKVMVAFSSTETTFWRNCPSSELTHNKRFCYRLMLPPGENICNQQILPNLCGPVVRIARSGRIEMSEKPYDLKMSCSSALAHAQKTAEIGDDATAHVRHVTVYWRNIRPWRTNKNAVPLTEWYS